MKKYSYVVSGNTFEHKNTIRNAGFQWHSGDKVWFRVCTTDTALKFQHLNDLEGCILSHTFDFTFAGNKRVPTGYKAPVVAMTQPQSYSYKHGEEVELKTWIVKKIAESENLEHVFRNVTLVEVLGETKKAIQANIKFNSKIANSCHLCGRALDTEISRATGIGPICAKKLRIDRGIQNDAEAVLKFLDQYAESVGTIGPVWIPKWAIK